MTSGHLVTYGNLALLGNVNLCKLHYSVGKLIADLYLVDIPLADRSLSLESDAIVVDELPDEDIAVLVGRPFVGVDVVVVDVLEHVGGELFVLGDDFHTVEVGHACTLLVLGQDCKFSEEFGPELFCLAVKFCLPLLLSCLLVASGGTAPATAFLCALGVEGSLDNGT